MARPRVAKWSSDREERESCINVFGLSGGALYSGHHGYPRVCKPLLCRLCFDSGARFARLIIKARDALDSVRVGVIALWVWRATKVTRGKVGTARCSLVETLMAIVL